MAYENWLMRLSTDEQARERRDAINLLHRITQAYERRNLEALERAIQDADKRFPTTVAAAAPDLA